MRTRKYFSANVKSFSIFAKKYFIFDYFMKIKFGYTLVVRLLFFVVFLLSVMVFSACNNLDKEDPLPQLEILTRQLVVDEHSDIVEVSFKNTGNIPLIWELDHSDSYLEVSPFKGKIAPGEVVVVDVKVFKEELSEGVYSSRLFLNTDQEIYEQIYLQIVSYEESKWLLDERIIDAEYDKNLNRIIAVTNQDNLLIIDPIKKEVQSIPLALPAVCVSVHPDGKSALVGHIAALSHVDLSGKRVLKQVGLPFEIFDVAMGKTEWAYISSSGYNIDGLYNFNLETGQLEKAYDFSIYARSRLKIDPSGNYLFCANTTIMPSGVTKVDISGGLAKYSNNLPYHGDFAIAGDVWFSEDGDEFFAKSGHVFQIANGSVFDMTHVGSLHPTHYFSTIAHSSMHGRIFGIHNPGVIHGDQSLGIDILAKYNTNFQLLEESRLPGFIRKSPQGAIDVIPSNSLFGFFSADGKYYYVLCEPSSQDASATTSALITIDLH